MLLHLREELGMEVGKMPVLVPPPILAERQSLGAAQWPDQNHMENVILVAKPKFSPSSLLFGS